MAISTITPNLANVHNDASPLAVIQDLFEIKLWNGHKLVTKEDGNFFHIHKILGILSLSHYAYRVSLLVRFGSMQFDESYFTLGCIFLHMLLSGTSFFFHISNVRNPGKSSYMNISTGAMNNKTTL